MIRSTSATPRHTIVALKERGRLAHTLPHNLETASNHPMSIASKTLADILTERPDAGIPPAFSTGQLRKIF